MVVDRSQQGEGQSLDIKVIVPELEDVEPFWIREFKVHRTFDELLQECVNHEKVRRSRGTLADKASRHFWAGDQCMLRTASVSKLSARVGGATGRGEADLVLRRDLYRIQPSALVVRNEEFNYVNAETPIEQVIGLVLSKQENPICHDLCDSRGKRLARNKSLADYALWPAWEDAPPGEFPDRARLRLRPRTSWQPTAVLVVTFIIGVALGFLLLRKLLG